MLHRSGLVVASALAAFTGSCVVEGTMSANSRGGSTGPYNRIHRSPRSASPPSDRMKVLKSAGEELEVEPDEKDRKVPHITSFGQLSTRDGSNSSLASTDCQSPLPNSTPARARCQQPPQDGEQTDNLLVQRLKNNNKAVVGHQDRACGPGDQEERPTTRRSTRTGFLGRLGNVCRRRQKTGAAAAEQEAGEGVLVEATGEGELLEGDSQQQDIPGIVTAVVLSNALCLPAWLPLAGKMVEKMGPQWLQQVCGFANQTEAAGASASWPQ
mmetsp:Transcript_4287/g.10450  ORF Transcript_4287/g.10450 Transcript_4287/m.10450 type:complete len:269 (+) Transcript_4287:149-955(+)